MIYGSNGFHPFINPPLHELKSMGKSKTHLISPSTVGVSFLAVSFHFGDGCSWLLVVRPDLWVHRLQLSNGDQLKD